MMMMMMHRERARSPGAAVSTLLNSAVRVRNYKDVVRVKDPELQQLVGSPGRDWVPFKKWYARM
jgi:hypothetical protein